MYNLDMAFVLRTLKRPLWLGLAALVVLAAVLRLRGYTQSPSLNADEYDWAWSGLTLIQNHVPTGWTLFWDAYGHWKLLDWQGNKYALVTPYLDHPPVFSVLVGGVAWLAGERALTDVNLSVIRLVPITLSLVVLVLAFLLGRATLGTVPTLIAVAMLAVSQSAIALARVTESEALLTVCLFAALLALHHLDRHPNERWAVILLLASCLIAPLVKLPGVAVGLAAFGITAWWHRPKLAFGVFTATYAGVSLFIVYGLLLDAQLFSHILNAQSRRHSGYAAGYELLRGGLNDWLWGLGIIGLGTLVARDGSRIRLIAWPVLAYVVVITLMASTDPVSYTHLTLPTICSV